MNIYLVDGSRLKRKIRGFTVTVAILVLISVIGITFDETATGIIDVFNKVEKNEEMVIIVDAGHGGEDAGATGVSGVYEKDLNLAISMLIGNNLREKGYTVVYTRTSDKLLYREEENIKGIRKISDLKNRCKIGDSYNNAIFVSIHMNTYGSSKYSGLQVYYADNREDSEALAACIQNNVKKTLQPTNRRQIKNGKSLYILDNCKATTVLVECGFISNEEECKKLLEKEYQNELSFSIVCGIIEYINSISS